MKRILLLCCAAIISGLVLNVMANALVLLPPLPPDQLFLLEPRADFSDIQLSPPSPPIDTPFLEKLQRNRNLVFALPEISIRTAEDYYEYMERQKETLKSLVGERDMLASITFRRPLRESELAYFLDKYHLQYEFFEYEATNNIHGGYSTRVMSDLTQVENYVKGFDPNVKVLGITYIIGTASTADMVSLQQENDVLLVDIGAVEEFDELKAQGKDVALIPAPSLYNAYLKFSHS